MKEEKKKIQKNFGITLGLLVLSIIYTLAIMYIDVRPIGPQGSVVGFAQVNQYIHTLLGTNMLLYNITDWLSIPILFIMLGFAMVGLIQLIKRKSLLRVDSSILILGGFYVLVFLVYLFFEFFVVNFRPVLIQGILEASYPSSTTMLMLCIMPTAIMQFQRLILVKRLRNIVNAFCGIYASFIVIGRVLSGVHWITDIVGGILFSATFVMLYYSINQWVNSKASQRLRCRSYCHSAECAYRQD
ncbi:phosphatase PAP2 family protein [Thomasclavelia sp.]